MNFEYEIISQTIRLTSYEGEEQEIDIPETIDSLPVTVIGAGTFRDSGHHIKSVICPKTLKRIETDAFDGCGKLEKLVLNEGLEVLNHDFAYMTALKEVTIPSTVRLIEDPFDLEFRLKTDHNPFYYADEYALYHGNELVGLFPDDDRIGYQIKEGTEKIRQNAFRNCSILELLKLPLSLKEIEDNGLYSTDVRNPRGVHSFLAPDHPYFEVRENSLVQKQTHTLIVYTGDEKNIAVDPDIEIIHSGAFHCLNMECVVIPESVKEIHENAFASCRIKEMVFEEDHTHILFPKENLMLMDQTLRGFGKNGKKYDFTHYDDLLHHSYLNAERIRMITGRLKWDRDLMPENKAFFSDLLSKSILDAVRMCAQAGDTGTIERLAELNLITMKNIGACVDVLSKLENREPLTVLLRYRHEYMEKEDFDFSL